MLVSSKTDIADVSWVGRRPSFQGVPSRLSPGLPLAFGRIQSYALRPQCDCISLSEHRSASNHAVRRVVQQIRFGFTLL